MCRDQAIVSSSMMDQTRNYKSRVSPYINGYGPQIKIMLILLTSHHQRGFESCILIWKTKPQDSKERFNNGEFRYASAIICLVYLMILYEQILFLRDYRFGMSRSCF